MFAKQQRKAVEWVGGLVTLPAHVTGEGEPYRPEALFWMSTDDGAVLGTTLAQPGELLGMACASLAEAIAQPMIGRPHKPARLRVASPKLAEVLRAGHPGIDVVCAPTPEIDAMFELMREHMDEDADDEQSYLAPGVEPEAVAALFRAAAKLYRAQPWTIVPDDQSTITIGIEALGLSEAVLAIIGQMGESFGFLLFASQHDFEAFIEAAQAIEHGEMPVLPVHFALNFERGVELSPALRAEIAQHGWEVAGADAYPWLVAIDPDLVAQLASTRGLMIAEAISLAVVEMLADPAPLLAAWSGEAPVARTIAVSTHAGPVEVSLRVASEPCQEELARGTLRGSA